MKKNITKKSSAKLDEAFDNGESVLTMAKKGGKVEIKAGTQKVNVNFPSWMVEALDTESDKLAVDRQAIIKMMINQALESKGYKAL